MTGTRVLGRINSNPPGYLIVGAPDGVAGLDANGRLSSGQEPEGTALSVAAVQTTAYTSVGNEIVPADATSAGFTVKLPSAPAAGTRVCVKKIDTSANVVTVACQGSDVLNRTAGSTSVTLTLTNQAVMLQYKATGAIWYITGDDLPLSSLSGVYVSVNEAPLSLADPRFSVDLTGATASTAGVQSWLNTLGGALGKGSGFIPTGVVALDGATALVIPQGIEIDGAGGSNAVGTPAHPGATFDASAMTSDAVFKATDFAHNLSLRRFRITGHPTGHGLWVTGGMGESSMLDLLDVYSNGGDGIRVEGPSTPLQLGHLSVHNNGGAGLRLVSQTVTAALIEYLAGDNNGESLLTVDGGSTYSVLRLLAWKAERSTNGGRPVGHDVVFKLNNLNGGLVDLGRGQVTQTTGGAGGTAIVQQNTTGGNTVGRVKVYLAYNNGSGGADYTNGYQDTANSASLTPAQAARLELQVRGQGIAVFDGSRAYTLLAQTPTGVSLFETTANPNALITATPGSIAYRTNGSAYLKITGTDNNGWVLIPMPAAATAWSAAQSFTDALKVLSAGFSHGLQLGSDGANGLWEENVAGTSQATRYSRFVGSGADERWMLWSKDSGIGAGVNTMRLAPGGTTALDLLADGTVRAAGAVQIGGSSGPRHLSGTGAPNGSVAGSVGDVYAQTDGTRANTFWVKESGTATNTGWVPRATPSTRPRSGKWLYPAGGASTTTTLVNGTPRYVPIFLSEPATVTEIDIEVTTLGSAGSVIRLGIYADDGSGFPSGSAILDAGTVDATSTGNKPITGLSTALKAGWYWLCAVGQGAPTTAPIVRGLNGSVLGVVGFAAGQSNLGGYLDSSSTVTGALGTPSINGNTTGPNIHIKIS